MKFPASTSARLSLATNVIQDRVRERAWHTSTVMPANVCSVRSPVDAPGCGRISRSLCVVSCVPVFKTCAQIHCDARACTGTLSTLLPRLVQRNERGSYRQREREREHRSAQRIDCTILFMSSSLSLSLSLSLSASLSVCLCQSPSLPNNGESM